MSLLVGSRDYTKLVDGVLKQVDAVHAALADGVPVRGALWPKKLYPQLQLEGALSAEAIEGIHRRLAKALPAA